MSRSPYKLARVTTEAIDYGEPTARFLAEFPNGVVPVNETRHLMPNHNDPFQALLDTAIVFEFERGRERAQEAAEHLRRSWHAKTAGYYDEYQARRLAWKKIVREMLAAGRSPALIAQQMNYSELAIAPAWVSYGAKGHDARTAPWQAVWVFMQEHPSYPEVCARFPAVYPTAIRRFMETCGVVPTRDELKDTAKAMYAAGGLSMTGVAREMGEDLTRAGWRPSLVVDWLSRPNGHAPRREAA